MSLISEDQLEPGWQAVLAATLQQPKVHKLDTFLQQQLASGKEILPQAQHWFNAFNSTPFDAVKVVILGQDPYPTRGHAHGLCFSVEEGAPLARSLNNIFRELGDDLAINVPVEKSGKLSAWAQQGVLLLNTVLTVEAGRAGSHRGQGWELITDRAIEALNQSAKPLVFILWGGDARKKACQLDQKRHLVIESAHPSPLSAYRGFFGSKPFSRCNEFLAAQNVQPIDWELLWHSQ